MYSGTLPWSNITPFTKVLHFANANRKHMKWVRGKNGHKFAHFLKKDMTQTFRQRCLTQRNGWQHTQYVQVTVPPKKYVLKEAKTNPVTTAALPPPGFPRCSASLRLSFVQFGLVPARCQPRFILDTCLPAWALIGVSCPFPQLPLANREGGSKQAKHAAESPFH